MTGLFRLAKRLCSFVAGFDDKFFSCRTTQALQDTDLRSHDEIIRRGNINQEKYAAPTVEERDKPFLRSTDDEPRNRETPQRNGATVSSLPISVRRRTANFATVLSLIQGSVLGNAGADDAALQHEDRDRASLGDRSFSAPSIADFARASNLTLDRKQYVAYKILCCSFLLGLVVDGSLGPSTHAQTRNAVTGHSVGNQEPNRSLSAARGEVRRLLKLHGAQDQLRMLLTGEGGTGKSTCVSLAQRYCHAFCTRLGLMFDDNTFCFTSTTGSSAALFGGSTIHSAAFFNAKKISQKMRDVWKTVKVLVIDEIGFFTTTNVDKLDRQLMNLKDKNIPYGGIHIVFSGDFYQLPPGKLQHVSFLLSRV